VTATSLEADEVLMAACRDGAPHADAAFAQLFERHRAAIWGYFRRRVVDAARAEDLMQDTFVIALRNAPRYEPRAPFRAYLFGIAHHLLLEERRRRPAGSDDGLANIATPAADLDAVLRVRQALSALDAMDREVLMLREFDALSYAEIAELLSVPLNTVRSRLFRARLALREQLQ
jgi:RNA polymerase sigma-70 factor (ECF subfamily)